MATVWKTQKIYWKNGNTIQWNLLCQWKIIACCNSLGVIMSMCKKLMFPNHFTIIASTTRMLGVTPTPMVFPWSSSSSTTFFFGPPSSVTCYYIYIYLILHILFTFLLNPKYQLLLHSQQIFTCQPSTLSNVVIQLPSALQCAQTCFREHEIEAKTQLH